VVEGIPYQTLVSSVLHKYIEGRLVEKIPNLGLRLSWVVKISGVAESKYETVRNRNLPEPKVMN
jgi:hypothetical protein